MKADEYAQDDTNGSYAGLGNENDHDVEQKIYEILKFYNLSCADMVKTATVNS